MGISQISQHEGLLNFHKVNKKTRRLLALKMAFDPDLKGFH